MTPAFIRLAAVTRTNRIEIIERVREAFLAVGAWITDFHEFSNLSLCINFEVPSRKMSDLWAGLHSVGLEITQELQPTLANPSPPSSTTEANDPDVTGTLQITFIHNDPDLIIPVPPIPG